MESNIKLEVGMYAFSKESRKYGIGKIIKIDENRTHLEVLIKNKKWEIRTRKEFVVASYDITDLIEEGDVLDIIYDDVEFVCKVDNREPKMVRITTNCSVSLGLFEIKSVVTKEQFESMMYKVGE